MSELITNVYGDLATTLAAAARHNDHAPPRERLRAGGRPPGVGTGPIAPLPPALRLRGLISLEIEGHFASMGLDLALFYDTEVDALLDGIGAVDRARAEGTDAAPPA